MLIIIPQEIKEGKEEIVIHIRTPLAVEYVCLTMANQEFMEKEEKETGVFVDTAIDGNDAIFVVHIPLNDQTIPNRDRVMRILQENYKKMMMEAVGSTYNITEA